MQPTICRSFLVSEHIATLDLEGVLLVCIVEGITDAINIAI